jgi:hypothetical protein
MPKVSFVECLVIPGLLIGTLFPSQPARGQSIDFDKQIAPILAERCLSCHSGAEPKGGLDLSKREHAMTGGDQGPILAAGKPGDSLLWEYIDQNKMPPKKPLPVAEKTLLREWIVGGAKWGTDPIDSFRITTDKRAGVDWWALRPVRQSALPTTASTSATANAIDAFMMAKLQSVGLQPSGPADRRTLIRRLSFDLLGLPPTPADVEAFVRDRTPDAYERLVDRYLASPRYGITWARHWLDIVRFGESNGFEHDEFRPNAWPYRDWVVDALNRDMPYDEFARLQLAGDVLKPGDAGALAATGFLVAGSYDSVGQTQQSAAMRKVVRQDELEDIVGTVGQTFLGLTVQCARCHDHKFDPVRQMEYYRMAAALNGVRQGERELPLPAAELAELNQALKKLQRELANIEEPAQKRIQAERGKTPIATSRPIASWDLVRGLNDQAGASNLSLRGGAKLSPTGLKVDGRAAYAVSLPLGKDLKAKTLEAWVSIDRLQQSGGGVISIQTRGGGVFDAIVFGETEPGRWQAGSDGFQRTRTFQAPRETAGPNQFIHVAVVYGLDGSITAYRDGKPYGKSYQSNGPVHFRKGDAEFLIGMRHAPAGGNRMLAGTVRMAQVHDRALSADEVAASARLGGDFVSTEVLLAHLSPEAAGHWHELRKEIDQLQQRLQPSSRQTHAVAPREAEPMYVLTNGDPGKPLAVAAPGGVAAVAGATAEFGLAAGSKEADARIRLANWITDSRNALFARVMVNRIWHYHFGAGLVETPNDFGFNGGRPSHSELLDWLANELVRRQWSMKSLHRLIVTSAAYRQSSQSRPECVQMDADNRLLWRMSPRRLEAETFRDAVLSITGELNERVGGPGFQEFNLKQAVGTVTNNYAAADQTGNEFNRRTLYRAWARGGRNKLLDTLDCPDPSTTAPRRAVTTTPLQALALMNNIFVLRQAKVLANRIQREAGSDAAAEIGLAYELAFGRPATAEEIEVIRQKLGKDRLEVLTRALLNSNEFLYVD